MGEQDDAIETFAWFASNASRDLISHCDVCAFMPTAIHQLDLPSTAKAVRIEVRVGAAHWTVDLDHRVLAALDCPSGEMEPETVHRVMENVRAKAVEMRWYGGGQISLEPSDLILPVPEPIRSTDGSEIPRAPWFCVMAIGPLPAGVPKLRVVD